MANIEVQQIVSVITLTLSVDEAAAILSVCRRTAGRLDGPRGLVAGEDGNSVSERLKSIPEVRRRSSAQMIGGLVEFAD